ncbi:zinc finger, CCHC-type containing protein, partial [Tanacetum coccineum]
KLPPSSKDFKHTLKHKKEELTLVELGSHMRIEESLRVQDSDKTNNNNVVGPLVINVVEHNNSSIDLLEVWETWTLEKGSQSGKVGNKANGSGTNGSMNVSFNSLKGATVHVCKDRCWFKTYESLNDGSILYMGNESTALVHERGCVDLRLDIVSNNIGSAFMSTSKLNNSIIWHARLGHVHFKRMQDMSKDGSILAFNMDTEKWIKKYFLTFINDASRFCYVYLLHSKDEALDKFKVFKTEVELQQGYLIKRFRTDRGAEYMDAMYF